MTEVLYMNGFQSLDDNELMMVDGGSVATAVFAGIGVVATGVALVATAPVVITTASVVALAAGAACVVGSFWD